MYLKNTSNTMCVTVNTIRGKVGIDPQEIVDIKYKILPPVSKHLIQVEEVDYLSFCGKTEEPTTTVETVQTENVQQSGAVVEEDKLEDMERTDDSLEIKDQSIMGFVNSLLNPKENEALVVTPTDSKEEIKSIEQQIEDLKTAWKETKSPNKKQKLSKEIKELQKQLKKVQE